LVLIHAAHEAAAEGDQLVVKIQSAASGIALLQYARDAHTADVLIVRRYEGAKAGVVGVEAGVQVAHEVLDLVDRNGVADTGVDAPVLVERAAAVDADQFALHVEERPPGIAGVDRRVDLDAVRVFQQGAGRVLITVHAADEAERNRRTEVSGQEERIAHG